MRTQNKVKNTKNNDTRRLYEAGIITKEQSSIFLAFDVKDGKEYVFKKDCIFGGVVITPIKYEGEWEINEKLLKLKNSENEKYISFVKKNNEKMLIFEKGVCDLSDFLQNGRILKGRTAEFFMYSMIKSVQLIHENKIAHNDIKLKNFVLFINENNEVLLKLIDFGSATTNSETFELNSIKDCLRLINILHKISDCTVSENQDRITQWIQYFQNHKKNMSINEICRNFLKEFPRSDQKLHNSDILKSLNEIENNICFNKSKNVSFDEFMDSLNKLCLVDKHPLKTLLRAEIMEKTFLEEELYTKYIKLIENKIILLNCLYFKDFRQCKFQNFSESFTTKIDGIEDSIEKLSIEMKKISNSTLETYRKNIHRNDVIYNRLKSLLEKVQFLTKFYQDIIENIAPQDENKIKKIEQIINENEKKIKIKNGKSVIHYEILVDFWRFLKLLLTNEPGKSLEERYQESFEVSLKKHLIFHYVNFEN